MSSSEVVDIDLRRAQVSSAKKKLKQFRASRSSVHSPPPTISHAPRASSSTGGSVPLIPSMVDNNPASTMPTTRITASLVKSVVLESPPDLHDATTAPPPSKPPPPPRHGRKASRHHRKNSSFASWAPPPSQQQQQQQQFGAGGGTARPSVMGVFEQNGGAASDETPGDDDYTPVAREILTTPASPLKDQASSYHHHHHHHHHHHNNNTSSSGASLDADDENESIAIARLSSFSFGAAAKAPAPGAPRLPLLPPLPIRDNHHHQAQISSPTFPSSPGSRPPSLLLTKAPPFPLDLSGFPSRESLSAPRSRPTSPTRKRHSHNRSESISLPNLKLGRPASLGLPSPSFPSAPNSPFGEVTPRSSSRLSTPISTRLKFEPSDKEKEESRRRALDKLTGGGSTSGSGSSRQQQHQHEEPRHNEITLPAFDDDDDLSATSSRPPSSTTMNSTASSSRPTSLIVSGSTSFNSGGSTSPLPWSTFEEPDRWNFSPRFDNNTNNNKDESIAIGFDVAANKTSSVLLNSGLGVLAEEDETESDEVPDGETDPNSSMADAPSPTEDPTPVAGPTPSRLRELHLVSSVSSVSASRRGSNPEVLQAFSRAIAQSRETPTKGYPASGRGRPRPLGLDEATSFLANSSPSPVKGSRPMSFNGSYGGAATRRPGSRSSSISYKKTDDSGSGSSRDFGSRGPTSPISSPTYVSSPLSEFQQLPTRSAPRPAPRPRSMVLGMGAPSGRILGEVDETEEEMESAGRVSTEASRSSIDSSMWNGGGRRDSRDRIDAEMERDALREDVELWRKRCRGLEDKLEVERREATLLRERVRKLGDRLLSVSSSGGPSAVEERAVSQSHLIGEMREQLFSMASALERVTREKEEAVARAAELQATVDAVRTPQVSPQSLPSTPKSRPRLQSLAALVATPPEAKYADADFADADDESIHQEPLRHPNEDPNLPRLLGWGFPSGPVGKMSRESKRESFFGLSRPRAVHAAKGSESGMAWASATATATSPTDTVLGQFDLPPIVVDASNRDMIVPVSPTRASQRVTDRVVSEPTRSATAALQLAERQHNTTTTPERQAAGGFGLSFLSGYLSIPGSRPVPAGPAVSHTAARDVPRIAITPSSVSPKKSLLHLERDVFNARVANMAPGCELDFRACCKRCTGEVIEL